MSSPFAWMLHAAAVCVILSSGWSVKASAQDSDSRGEDLYAHHCIGCHQEGAKGDAFRAVPSLAGQNPVYLQRQLEHFAFAERASGDMHWALRRFPVDRSDDRAALVSYLTHLPPNERPDSGSARAARRGEALYQARCLRCHGADAGGLPAGAIPSLRHQHDSYLRSRLRGLGLHQDLALDSAMRRAVEPLSPDEVVQVAAYLSRL